jgi:hypothetical protein
MNEYVYLNFPVQMMQGGFTKMKKICSDAIDYGIYDYMKRNQLGGFDGFKIALMELNLTCANQKMGYNSTKEIYQQVQDSIDKPVTVSVKKDMLFEFYKNDKSEFEIAVFLAYVGLKSIIGTKPYIKITNDYLIARMFGYGSIAELEKDYSEERVKYSTRYHLDKVKAKLESQFGLKLYGQKTRGFYFSFKLSLSDLVYYAELKRESRKEKERKALKADTINQVLNHFKGKK